MMRLIIAWSMQLRLVVVAAAAVLIFFGVTRHLGREESDVPAEPTER